MFKTAQSNENVRSHIRKTMQAPSLLPEVRPTEEASQKNIINTKSPIGLQEQQHFRFKSRANLAPPKYKRKTKKPSIVKLATIFRPDILHNYLSYNEIVRYLDHIKLHFTEFVKIHTLGTTFERRAIKCIEINWNRASRVRSAPLQYVEFKQLEDVCSRKSVRNVVFIEGGTHAREWLSITVALNCIHQLTENNVRHRDLLRKLKFFIVPVVNPDGYEYARNVVSKTKSNFIIANIFRIMDAFARV